MFTDHSLNWRSIIWLFVIIATAIWFIIFALQNVEDEVLFESFFRIALVFGLIFLIWKYFVKNGWKHSFLNKYLVNNKPDLSGRWVGIYVSTYDNKHRKVALEIKQTLFTLICRLWGEDNFSEVYSAGILSTNDFSNFKLILAYKAKRNLQLSKPGDQHEGLAVLSLIKGQKNKLDGNYMTDRDPVPTKGSINLMFESSKLKGEL